MTQALSNDLLERVVAAVLGGASCRSVASRFGMASSSVVKWSQRYRSIGSVAPAKMGEHRKRILEPYRAFIHERLNQNPQLTMHDLKAELAVRGVTVSHSAVWQIIRVPIFCWVRGKIPTALTSRNLSCFSTMRWCLSCLRAHGSMYRSC